MSLIEGIAKGCCVPVPAAAAARRLRPGAGAPRGGAGARPGRTTRQALHERLLACQLSREFYPTARVIARQLPRGFADLGDQLTRAARSSCLAIAEGANARSIRIERTFFERATASNGEGAISSSARRVSRSGSCAGPERRLPGPGARCQWPTRSATRVKGHPHSPTGTSNPHLPPSPPRPPGPARASSSPLKRYSDNADGTCARRIRRQPIACA